MFLKLLFYVFEAADKQVYVAQMHNGEFLKELWKKKMYRFLPGLINNAYRKHHRKKHKAKTKKKQYEEMVASVLFPI